MKKVIAGVLLSFILLTPSLSHAQTTTATLQAQYQAALLQLIQLLTQRVEMLQAQLAAQQQSQTAPQNQPAPSEDSDGTLTVSTVPLLTGGNARANQSVPVSYLQVRNTSSEAVHLSGFRVQQNGTAPASVVARLTSLGDTGNTLGTSEDDPFDSGIAFVPVDVTIVPRGLELFTVRAVMAGSLTADLYKTLKLDIIGVESNGSVSASYPLRGTTWTLNP